MLPPVRIVYFCRLWVGRGVHVGKSLMPILPFVRVCEDLECARQPYEILI